MATALQGESEFSQILECPICWESFTRPKILSCGHTFCALCLQSHISNKVTHSMNSKACFPCPVCKADILVANPNICIEHWAESFPVNSIVSALIDVSARNKEGYYCDQCIKDGKKSMATHICKDCDRSMCMSCKKSHDGFPSLIWHDVINVREKADCFEESDMSSIEVCKRHRSKRIQFFCGDDSTMCCSYCVKVEHRECKRILTLKNMLKSFDSTKKSEEIQLNMTKFADHLNHIIRIVKSNSDNIRKDKDNILEHIHSLKSQMMAKLQNCEENVIDSLQTKYESENCNLQNHESKGRSLFNSVDNDRTKLDLVMTQGSEIQKAIILHNLDQNQEKYFRAVLEYQKDIKDVRFRFDIDETFSTYLNTISKLGSVSLIGKQVDFSAANVNNMEASFQRNSTFIPMTQHLKEMKVLKVREFNVRTYRDKNNCHISHILLLKDSRILLVDHNNYKVKLFGEDYRCQESMKFEGFPWFACSLSNTQVAVTIPCQTTIQIIGVKNVAMQKKREIKTRYECWGIAVLNDQLVVTTNGHIVLILDMDGTEMRAIQTKKFHSEKYLDPRFIKVDTTTLATYVSYPTAHKLVAYSKTWDVLFTYTHQDPAGIDIDREGNIYLCESDSHCVQQISAKGQPMKTLISKREQKMTPLSVIFFRDMDKNTDSFFLTYCGCDIVEVYELLDSQN